MAKKPTLTERVAELERELSELKANPPVIQYVYPYWSVIPPNNPPYWQRQTTWKVDTTANNGNYTY